MNQWRTLPQYALGAGFFGLIVVGQLVFGVLADQFGWLGTTIHPIDLPHIVGAATFLVNVWLQVN